jgi:hypothetical protein
MSDSHETNPEAIPAVARCCQAMQTAFRAVKAAYDVNGDESALECQDRAAEAAQRAYCQAMPPLSGCENIRNFIACVAHGMMLDVFTGAESTRLLYAAQVAKHRRTRPRAQSRHRLKPRLGGYPHPPARPNSGAKSTAVAKAQTGCPILALLGWDRRLNLQTPPCPILATCLRRKGGKARS